MKELRETGSSRRNSLSRIRASNSVPDIWGKTSRQFCSRRNLRAASSRKARRQRTATSCRGGIATADRAGADSALRSDLGLGISFSTSDAETLRRALILFKTWRRVNVPPLFVRLGQHRNKERPRQQSASEFEPDAR